MLRTSLDSTDLDDLVSNYTDGLSALIDKHAPLHTRVITLRPSSPWFNEELHDAKHLKRKLERQWRRTKLTVHHEIYRNQCAVVNKLLKETRINYYSEKIKSCRNDYKNMFKITKHLLGMSSDEPVLPSNKSVKELAQEFSDFFINKIETIRHGIASGNQSNSNPLDIQPVQFPSDRQLTTLTPATSEK